jgi:hypothetical protein
MLRQALLPKLPSGAGLTRDYEHWTARNEEHCSSAMGKRDKPFYILKLALVSPLSRASARP